MHGLPSGNVFVLLRRRYVILVYLTRAILTGGAELCCDCLF